ncbi:MAG TPA: hypothetical protein VNA12_04415 [Mycobacteriales bacterium]|nr:hypothetical protein [Mycobacteriales bacterium]
MSLRRSLTLCTAALLLALSARGDAFQPQVVDAAGDAPTPSRDIMYALFENYVHPADGDTLQITLGLNAMPVQGEPATYSVAFEHGDCGGGRVAYDWQGGGVAAPLTGTATKASFWTCDVTVDAAGESVYAYTEHTITVTWLEGALQFWVPLKVAGLTYGTTLSATRACSGQSFFRATTDLRRRTGIDCSIDSSPRGESYVIGS